MRASRRLIAFAAVAALVGAACGSDDTSDSSAGDTTAATTEATETTDAPDTTDAVTETTEATTEDTTTETTLYEAPPRGDADLVIWADETRASVLEPIADEFAAAEGITVDVVEIPNGEIRSQFSTAAPAGEGPDIVTGAHDWLGEFVSNGVIAPIDLGPDADLYAPVAIEAFTYDGALYGVPYAIENIALIRNVDLVPEAPATFEDLEATALALQADGTVDVPLGVQQDPADPYHNYPLFSALGGYVFGQNDDGTYNADDVGIDSDGGLAAAQKFADWSNEGLISKDVSQDIMKEAFSTGKSPFVITGPWNVGDFTDAGINFVVEPDPAGRGWHPRGVRRRPGLHAVRVQREPRPGDDVHGRLPRHRGSAARAVRGWQSPAGNAQRLRPGVERPDRSRASALAGQQGTPLPAIPEMGSVWESWTDAYSLIFTGTDPVQAFTDAAAQIREKIAEG